MKDEEIRTNKKIRSVDISDWDRAMDFFTDIQGTRDRSKWSIKVADRSFADGQFPEDIFGTKAEMDKRIYDGLEFLIRFFINCNPKDKSKIFHLLAVSHFEVLHSFASLLFKDLLDEDTYNLAEKIDIEFDSVGNMKVKLKCEFRGQKREIVFDRRNRKFVTE